ncbi:MAG: NAD(+) diphosphatase [Rhodobacteraceae bacterium]|nr:NAD(+) diphosphatase [Paracoccaceae bacterium]
MKTAEQVTFGGAGLDRAAHYRGSSDDLKRLTNAPEARALLLWRGKILVRNETRDSLLLVSMDHELVMVGPGGSVHAPVFLGITRDGAPRFACDISNWEPADLDEAVLEQFFDPTAQCHPDLPEGHAFVELRGIMTRLSPLEAELAATAKAILGWHKTHLFCACCGHPSDCVEAGWQRRCPSCGASHFPRTDPVVIMLITHGDDVLMGRSPGWPEGMYSLLAGFVEPGETLEAAVRREVFEEAGIQVGEVEYLSSQPWPFPASLMFGCAGRALNRELQIDPIEIEDAIWVSRQEMMAAFAGEHPVLKPARKGAIAHFLLQNWLADTLD